MKEIIFCRKILVFSCLSLFSHLVLQQAESSSCKIMITMNILDDGQQICLFLNFSELKMIFHFLLRKSEIMKKAFMSFRLNSD